MTQQATAAPAAPVLAPQQVTVAGAPLSSPQSVYQAFRAQRRELARQLESLEDQRESLTGELTTAGLADASKKGIEQRIASMDERIIALDKQIADADAQVARAAAIPGAAIDPPPPPRDGPPEEFWVLGGMLIVFVMLPISIAYARRIWRRSAKIVTTFPKELSDRLLHVEQAVEATALEVERIGEGQRFMTKLFTDGAHSPAAQRIPAQSGSPNP
jgi:hypothetical protein